LQGAVVLLKDLSKIGNLQLWHIQFE